jgi:hypothetical protein
VSIATRRGHAGPSAATRPVNSGTRDRGSDSGRRRRASIPSAPGEELLSLYARDRSRNGRDVERLGLRELGAAKPHAPERWMWSTARDHVKIAFFPTRQRSPENSKAADRPDEFGDSAAHRQNRSLPKQPPAKHRAKVHTGFEQLSLAENQPVKSYSVVQIACRLGSGEEEFNQCVGQHLNAFGSLRQQERQSQGSPRFA